MGLEVVSKGGRGLRVGLEVVSKGMGGGGAKGGFRSC